MNEVAFRPWPQRRQWCLNTFTKTCLILGLRWLPRWRRGKLRHLRSLWDDFTLICGAGSFRRCIVDGDPFFPIGLLEWVFDWDPEGLPLANPTCHGTKRGLRGCNGWKVTTLLHKQTQHNETSRVWRNPSGNDRQERMDAVSGLKDGKNRANNALARQQDRQIRRTAALKKKMRSQATWRPLRPPPGNFRHFANS